MNASRYGLLILLFLLGVGLIIASFQLTDDPAGSGADAGDPGTAGTTAAADEGKGEPAAPPPRVVRSTTDPARSLLIRGTVYDRSGQPVAGARVEALPKPPMQPKADPDLLVNYLGAYLDLIRERSGRGEVDLNAISLKCLERSITRGVPSGDLEPSTLTGPDGGFTLSAPEWPAVWLRARKAPLATPSWVRAHPDRPVPLTVVPAGTVRILVNDPAGKPLADTRVRLLDLAMLQQMNMGNMGGNRICSFQEGRTDRDGAVLFAGLELPGPYQALVLAPGRPPVPSGIIQVSGAGTSEARVIVGPGATLQVTVKDPDGGPLPGVRVVCNPTGLPFEVQAMLDPIHRTTPADGRVLLTGLPPGKCLLQAMVGHRQPCDRDLTLEPGTRTEVVLTLDAGAHLVGTVRNSQGEPVPDALVTMVSLADVMGFDITTMLDPLILSDPISATRTDAEGRWRIAGLPDRRLSIVAWAPAYAPKVKKGIRPHSGPGKARRISLVLDRTGGVSGRVLDPHGAPVTAYTITASRELLMAMRSRIKTLEVKDPEGRFTLTGLLADDYILRVQAPDHPPLEVPNLRIEAGTVVPMALPLRLQAGGALGGRVEGTDRRTVAGATVTLIPSGSGGQLVRIPGFAPPAPTTTTDREGRFSFANLSPGSYTLEAAAGGAGQAKGREPLTIAADRTHPEVTITLEPAGTIAGQVFDSKGRPAANIAIMLQRIEKSGFKQMFSRTDDQGRFRATQLRPGRWQVLKLGGGIMGNIYSLQNNIRKSGTFDLGSFMSGMQMQMVQLKAGEVVRVTLGRPQGQGGAITGVVRRNGNPYKGAMVIAVPLDRKNPSPAIATSDKEGGFTFANLTPGRYKVVAQASVIGMGGRKTSQHAEVVPGGEAYLEIQMGGSRLSGTVVLQGVEGTLGGRLVQVRNARGRERGVAFTDRQGHWSIGGLAAGRYTVQLVTLQKPARMVGRTETVDLARGEHRDGLRLPITPSARLRGSVEGDDPGGARVMVYQGGSRRPRFLRADENGLFSLDGLLPGPVRLVARKGDRKDSLELRLLAGQENPVVLHLKK